MDSRGSVPSVRALAAEVEEVTNPGRDGDMVGSAGEDLVSYELVVYPR